MLSLLSRGSGGKSPLLVIGTVIGLSAAVMYVTLLPVGAQPRPSVGPIAGEPVLAGANELSRAFRAAAEKTLPAVVSVERVSQQKLVRKERNAPRGRGQLPPGFDDLDPLFKRFFNELPDGNGDQLPRETSSSGSGIIIDAGGIVLTNNHVVAGGGKVTVKLHDGREFEAAEVKTDPSTDVAIIKLKNASKLPTATLGDSDMLDIGDWVLALGQPFGLQDSVTQGIISAKNRGIGITKHAEFLQTDAAINPGNSGGPLVNLRGEVVGLNTAISSTSGGYQGIGFAVPVNVVKWVVPQLLKDGKVHRAFLGVGIQLVDQALADQLGMGAPSGAVVTDVQPKSPAGEAGIQSQDVIVEFAGHPVLNPRQLQAIVSRSPLGSKQPVVVLRDGKRVALHVVIREAPVNYGERNVSDKEVEPASGEEFKDLGLELAPLSKDVAEQLGLKEPDGVVIVSVADDSPAAAAGLRPSQAIVQVGRSPVKSVDEFKVAIKNTPLEKGVLLLVRTEEGSRFVVVKAK